MRATRTIVGCCVVLWVNLVPSLHARARADAPPPRADANVTTYGFDDEFVVGVDVSPGLEVLHGRRRLERESLVRVRSDYLAELQQSVEAL